MNCQQPLPLKQNKQQGVHSFTLHGLPYSTQLAIWVDSITTKALCVQRCVALEFKNVKEVQMGVEPKIWENPPNHPF